LALHIAPTSSLRPKFEGVHYR